MALFSREMQIRGAHASDLGSDAFDESEADDVGIDELLAVRMAQACGSAPLKAKGKNETERIPNRHPLALKASEIQREDLAVFIDAYGGVMPRQTFLQTLESGIAIGLTNLLLSTARLLAEWERTGTVPDPHSQIPWPLFVDASQGQDRMLRDLSEASMTECLRCYERLPVQMMLLRTLDDRVCRDSHTLRMTGADQVLIASRHRVAVIKERAEPTREPRLADILPCVDTRALDLVLVEGFKHEAIPKIELYRPCLTKPMIHANDPHVIAVVSDAPFRMARDLPPLDLNWPQDMLNFWLSQDRKVAAVS